MPRIRKRKLLEHIIIKEGLENLTFTWHIKGRGDKGRLRATYLMSLSEWKAGSFNISSKKKLLRGKKGQEGLECHLCSCPEVARDRRSFITDVISVFRTHSIPMSEQQNASSDRFAFLPQFQTLIEFHFCSRK